MSAEEVVGIVMYSIGVPVMAIMIIFAMRYGLKAFQVARGGEYQALAERTAAAQAETAASLSIVKAQLSDVAASLAAVHKILKQVD